MTEAERQYFEQMESLFAHPGWKTLMADVAAWQEAISSQWRSIKPEDLRFEQGRYDGLNQVATFEGLIESLKGKASEDFE